VELTPASFERTKRAGANEIIAPRVAAAPVIDGDLSDDGWDDAAVVKSFWRGGSSELSEAQTIAWVAFDKENLYVAFACQDKKVVGVHYEHDTKQIWQNDAVEVYLAPEGDPSKERQFILGIGDSRYDRHAGLGKYDEQVAWNPKPDWEGKIKSQPWGYTAELRIPIAALVDAAKLPVNPGTVWKLKLARLDYGEHKGCLLSSWLPIGDSSHDPFAAGDLVFEARPQSVLAPQPGKEDTSFCLTGNATGALASRNKPVTGVYTYTEPMTIAADFPNWWRDQQPPEPLPYAGGIPFAKGRLTDGSTATTVQWGGFWTGPLGHDITFDLGGEYAITSVVLLGTSSVGFEALYLKSPGEPRFTLVADHHDLFSFDNNLATNRVWANESRFDNVNQAARWVRVQHRAKGRGISEIQIWGKPTGSGATPGGTPPSEAALPGASPPRRAALQAGGATPVQKPKGEPVTYQNIPPVFPQPQEMKLKGSALTLTSGMVIAYAPADSKRARTTAEVLRDEMLECYGVKLEINPKDKAATIHIGQDAKGLPAQGYTLFADGSRIVIAGSDAPGAFYGAQTLLSLTRRGKTGGWEIPGATIRDWPDMPIRYIQGRPAPDKNLIRALARFRITHYEPQYRFLAEAAKWDKEAARYFVNLVPMLDFNTLVLQRDPNLVERASDEQLESLGVGRRNANPNHPKSWEIYFAECDKWLPQFHGDLVHINWDETYQVQGGARWNVSAESRALNMTAGQLLAHTLRRIDKKFKEHGKRIAMHDTAFMGHQRLSYPGDPDPDWNKALDLIPKDTIFLVWHPKEVNELLRSKGFAQLDLVLDETDWRKRDLPGPYLGVVAYMAESAFTPTKLLELAGVAWNTKAVRPQDPPAVRTVSRTISLWKALHEERRLPSLYASKNDFVPLDLSKAANRSRLDPVAYDGKDWVDMGANMDLRALKPGVQQMAGVPFRVLDEKRNDGKSIVMIENRGYVDRTMPTETEIDLGNIKAASLVFLHCLDNRPGHNYLRRKELAGFYFMVYDDGTYAKKEIKYAVNTANWSGRPVNSGYNPRGHNMTDGQLAWQGETLSGLKAYLYSTEWVNPHPAKPIRKILFRTAHSMGNMNPMLFAVTAVKGMPPSEAAIRESSSDRLEGRPSELLLPAKPTGTFLDLRGGKDESETRYVAPDGTVIAAETINNTPADHIRWDVIEYRSFVGMVNHDSNKAARTMSLTYTFPKPLGLSGALITAAYRMERKTEDFAPAVYDVFLELSDDGGKTWRVESSVKDTSPEEHGPVWLAVQSPSAQHARIRVEPKSDTCTGIAHVEWYRR
jgi:hypothetical protein